MNPLGDERLSDEACMNWACDALAKPCAFSGWENELRYHNYWGPTPTAEAPAFYFSSHGRAWTTEPYTTAKNLAGAACMRRSEHVPAAGLVFRLMEHGIVDGAATTQARASMTSGARAAAARAHLGQLRSSVRELASGIEGKGVKRLQSVLGGGEPCLRCAEGKDSLRHYRFGCEAAKPSLANIELAESEILASNGRALWWHPERRVSYTGRPQAAGAIAGWNGVHVDKDDRSRVQLTDIHGTVMAKVPAERVRILQEYWRGPHDGSFAVAATALLARTVAKAETDLAHIGHVAPALLAWTAKWCGIKATAQQVPTMLVAGQDGTDLATFQSHYVAAEAIPRGHEHLWSFKVDKDMQPYQEDVVIVLDEKDSTEAKIKALWPKLAATLGRTGGGRVLVFLKNGKGRTLQQLEDLHAKNPGVFPAGTVMWGNAAGWRNIEQKRALWQLPKHTH